MNIREFIEHLEKLNFSLAVENGKLNLQGDNKKLTKDEMQAIKKNDFVINFIKEHRDELIEYVTIFKSSNFDNQQNIASIYRLSGLQAGMLFHGLYDEASGAYLEQFKFDLVEPDLDLVIKSWEHLLKRHTILRSGFYYDVFNVPVQCVYREVKLPVTILDYSDLSEDEQSDALKKYDEADREKHFDFKSAPLMRVGLIKLDETRYKMMWSTHHILFDGWSIQILMEEFLTTYETLVSGKELKGEEDRYEDYIRYIERIDKEEQEKYWRDCMKGLEHGTLLPFTGATTQRTKGVGSYGTVSLQVNEEITAKVASYAQRNHITINTVMQGVWSYLLHRYSGSSDIVYGVVVSGRPEDLPEVEKRVGMFVNTLPLHSSMDSEQKISGWLKNIQNQQISSRHFQYTPLQDIQGWAGIQGDLFDSILGFENYPVNKIIKSKKWSLQVENVQILEQTNYPLSIIIGSAEQISIHFSYNTGILDEVYVRMLRNHFENVLQQIIDNPEGKISEIELLTKSEARQFLLDFNDTEFAYPKNKTVLDLFESQVLKAPESTAVVSEQEQLTYRELNKRSNQLAHFLKSKGVIPETPVSVCMERGIDIITAMLGILKAGGAYVPIDPEYPAERISYMLEDTGSPLVLTSKEFFSKLNFSEEVHVIKLDEDWSEISKQPTDNLQAGVQPNNLVYVIYTSGSTGLPKGVMVEHTGLVNLVTWHNEVYSVSDKSRATVMSGIGFDAFGWEIWPYLCAGASITIVDDDTRLSVSGLSSLLDKNEITHCFMPTALVPEFINPSRQKLKSLKYLLTGGDKLPGVNIDGESFKLINNYGPTENTVVTTYYELSSKDNNLIPPIGKPIFNTVIYILDPNGKNVPIGVAGEIHIGGAGLARGYLNQPELTEEKFIPNPFDSKRGSRLYKTGDIGKWLPDGNIEYIRRLDDQVKIRGFRIELGEIETAMNKLEQVNTSCVVVKKDINTSSRLVGYYVPDMHIVKAKERELYTRLVANWNELYEEEYAKTELAEDIDPEFNIIGWNDSFNGDAIPAEQMKEWVDDIVEVIMSEKPGHVLEIGSGTGLIYYQLAGKVKKYTGADFSRSSMNQISDRISKGLRDYGPTELKVCAAHEVNLEEGEKVDTIILNSIVQYFPGEDYMTDVIGKSISLIDGKGRIVVGDVRDNRLLELFKSRIQIKRLSESVSIKEFKWAVEQEVLREKELCFSPDYFYGLKLLYPQISHIEIKWKQASYINELSLYRYTVVIHIGEEEEVSKPEWQSWESIGDKQKIIAQLQQGNTVAIKDFPNPRLWQERLISKVLQDRTVKTLGELLETISKEDNETLKAKNFIADVVNKGFGFRLLIDDDIFKINLVLEPKLTNKIYEQPYDLKGNNADTLLTNVPLFTDISEMLQKDIRVLLHQSLPEYMVPSELISLSQLPLTSNGKVDRSFLSQREERNVSNKLNFVAPRNEAEEKLASVWKELLHLEKVGIHDNFFELGGDSIISIQVVSRARRLGYELKPKDIFIHQTIGSLSAAIAERTAAIETGEQGLLKGRSGLLPIQQWYFERTDTDVSHFNQSVLLSIDKSVTPEILNRAVEILTAHHDALRFRYQRNDGQWIQEYDTTKGGLIKVDLKQSKKSSLAGQIEEHSNKYQRSLNIEKGDISKFVLFQTPEHETHNRILIVIHHLAVDGVSWRILLEDLELLLSEIRKEGKADPGYKTSSYRQWYNTLEQYSNSRRLLSQIPYWEKASEGYEPLKVDKTYKGTVTQKDIKSHSIRLNTAQTQLLLQEVPGVFHTEINDMLLCALALALCEWGGKNKIIIGLEGHGRENISEVIDTSRTVGWFTSLYPVSLEVERGTDLSVLIKSVKEQLRSVPDKGLGYGVRKYISKDEKLSGKDCWDVVFNYLGQLDNVVSSGKWLSGAEESKGAGSGGEHTVSNLLSLNGMVQGGELILNWGYSSLHFEKETISKLAERYKSILESLISHCMDLQKSGSVYTPTDYGLGLEVGYEELDRFMDEPVRGKSRKESAEGLYRLSGLQQGLLFHSLYGGKAGLYINQFSCDLINPDVENLIKSWNHVLKNHSILRSSFYYDVFSVPVQCVYDEVEMPAEVLDFRKLDSDKQNAAVKEYAESDLAKGFDFKTPPLIRIGLLRLSDDRYQMLMTYHHLLFDGWSVQILIDEFIRTYELLVSGKEVTMKEDDLYEDYIRYIERRDKETEEIFWRNYLKGAERSTLLPFIGATPDRTKGLGLYKLSVLQLDNSTTEKIHTYAQAHRITLNTVLQGVWSFLLHKYTGSKDIIYGVTVSGRPDDLQNVEQRVGMYINTVPSHSTISETQSVTEWLQGQQTDEVLSRQYQYTSLQNIQRWIEIQGDLFDNTLTFQNFPMSKLVNSPKLSLRVENFSLNEQNNFPLSLTILSGEKIDVRFTYNSGLLKDEYVNEIMKHFENVLLQFIQNEKAKLEDVKLLTKEEEHQLLKEFNDTHTDQTGFRSVVSLFEDQVKKKPNAIAAVFKDQLITYKELNERSNKLAHYLSSKGVKADSPVFICIENSADMIIGIFGILKAGGAYVPIDPGYPEARINQMLEDTESALILTNKENRSKFNKKSKKNIVVIDESSSLHNDLPASNLGKNIKENDLAYVIYTSGSTGKPKGVMIEHGHLFNYLINSKTKYVTDEVKTSGSFLHLSYTFDASVTGIFMPLIHGKSIVISSKPSINAFEDTNLQKYAPYDFIKITPSHLELLQSKMKTGDGKLLTGSLVIGGEALLKSQLSILIEKGIDVEIINEYGPTEATVGCSTFRFNTLKDTENLSNEIPIGKPIDNVQLFILGENDELQPVGIAGELCISGKCLSRGYLKRPELTAEKFSKNPFSETEGSRMYRTGDLCRWLPDGTIEYAGRIDDQIKIRGYRVELGEIESVLQQCGLVNNATVIAKEDKSGSRRLVAYVVPKNNFDKDVLTSYLSERLPEYMIPSLWVELKSMPLTSNGKTDKKALPDPEISDSVSAGFTEPRNEIEAKLVEVWKDVLEIDKVGVTDDFFDLGGHSLLAISLISAIRNELGVEIPINDVFDYPTIEFLSKRIDNKPDTEILPLIEVEQPKPEFIPLSFSQERLWFIDNLGGSTQYHIPVVLRLKGKLNKDALIQSIQTLVNRHEVLRTVFEEQDGVVFQKIKKEDDWQLEVHNKSAFKKDSKELNEYIQKFINTPFDLSQDHMLRAALLNLDKDEHLLIVTLHHIASDGWSISVIVRELVDLYNAFEEGREANLLPLKIQYSDYAIWQRKYLQGEVLENKLSYWKEKLDGVSPIDLPADHTRPAVQSSRGAILNFKFEKDLSDRLQELSKNYGATLFMTLLGAFKVLMYRYSGQNDICVGTPVAGRQQQETEDLIGYFINTLALRSEVDGTNSFTEFLLKLRDDTLKDFAHQDVPFEKVVDAVVKERSLSRSPLFQVMFMLQNVPEAEELVFGNLKLSRERSVHNASKFDLTFSMSESTDGINGMVEYCTDLYKEETVERMITHFKKLLESIVRKPQQKIDSLNMIAEPELTKILVEFNDTEAVYPKHKSFIELFEEAVKKNADGDAVVFKNSHLTFKELNERSNQLAHYLKSKGVKAGTLIPICMEPGIEMVLGIIGILKAGGAYVPIDPEFPEKRIDFIYKDIKSSTLLTSKELSIKLSFLENIEIIELDGDLSEINNHPLKNLKTIIKPEQLAYVIYTSGSTGQPKGVMIGHGNLVSYLLNSKTRYISNDAKSSGSFIHLSFTFDASITGMFMPLINGKTVVIGSEKSLDVFEDTNFIKYAPYDFIKITPAHFELLQTKLKTSDGDLITKKLIVGGEALLRNQFSYLTEAGIDVSIVNEYGPTEATVGCSVYEFNAKAINLSSKNEISIGKPIDNVRFYILGEANEVMPIGITGEIYIAGPGLAKGYLNRPDLTEERFINDTFSKETGARLYKTGDLGRWLTDGNIEYLGRKDDQVKVRGYRIELGEIESVLQECELVRQAVVLARQTTEGSRRLIAYVVPEGIFDKAGMVNYLSSSLPDYMIPVIWMEMENLPLTQNGKIDRRALPDPEASELIKSEFTAPRNETERVLAEIWKELLRVERVGIHDNFFELGGDSIITIQVLSRARRLGYELKPKDIFIHQTIANLSLVLEERSVSAVTGEQGILTGRSGLLPIQQWYFQEAGTDISHFNQSVLLSIEKSATPEVLNEAVEKLMSHHDALRFAYKKEGGQWAQEYGKNKGALITLDLSSANEDSFGKQIKEHAEKYQRSLDIEKGEIAKFVLLQTPDQQTHNRLLIIIHHLAVDGVSWRIILDDLELLLSELKKEDGKSELGKKSTSYRQWYEALEQYGKSNRLLSQSAYWEEASGNYEPLKVDKEYAGVVRAKDIKAQTMNLDKAQTQLLLQEVPGVYHTEINDMLLCALALTFGEWQSKEKIIIGLEGHGRENISEGVDTSRTVGWFTSLYPVILKTERESDISDSIKSVKEQLRRVPDKGLGYGVLKYINKYEKLKGRDCWEIVFNYLGQIDNVVSGGKLLTGAVEPKGVDISPDQIAIDKFIINGYVNKGQLSLIWNYSSLHYEQETIAKLVEKFKLNLETLISHCIDQQKVGNIFTPSDYNLVNEISYQELDRFFEEPYKDRPRRDSMEALYRLSGLQQGMLFHSLYDSGSDSYTEQLSCDLINPDLDIISKSWNHIIRHHSILRSGFYFDAFNIPVQCVYKEAEIPVTVLDYREMNAEEQSEAIKEYSESDKQNGFDFKFAPLMRITLIRMTDDRYRMLWTSHHILFDGWSLPVLMEEFLNSYELLISGKEPELTEVDKYEDYIRYIEREDKDQQEAYWREYMKGVEQSTLLPFIGKTALRNKDKGIYENVYLNLNEEQTNKLERYVQRHHITTNTLMQGIWSYLLHRYTGSKDIVYGIIVSGRPDDLPAIERRVGMYVNTIPLHSVYRKEQGVVRWLQGIQDSQLYSRQYQYTSIQEIQEWTEIQGDMFDSILVFENYPVSDVIRAKKWSLDIQNVYLKEESNFPFTVLVENSKLVNVGFYFKPELMSEIYACEIRDHFEYVLMQVIKNDEYILNDIKILTEQEEKRLLVEFNNTDFTYPPDKTVIELFEEQSERTPDNIALIFENKKMTYRELNEQSNQLANYLRNKGVKDDMPVPLFIDRSLEMIIAIIGTLKAGGAYVPVDPEYPDDRIAYMLEDTNASIIISSKECSKKLPETDNIDVININSDWSLIERQSSDNLDIKVNPKSLVYIIYTSGSTGKPKGVKIEHRGLVNLALSQKEILEMNSEKSVLQFASYGFDASCSEIFVTLLSGGCLVIPKKEDLLSIDSITELIKEHKIDVVTLPSSYQSLIKDSLKELDILISAGEPLNGVLAKEIQSHGVKLFNAYGPTENTVCVTMSDDPVLPDGIVTIGKPIQNVKVYILDDQLEPVPIGVAGELCVGGVQVARGYLNRPDLTEEKFIRNPFSTDPDDRLYKTGDSVKWLPDGNIEYLGRLDDQIKIAGHRIEFGEIESLMTEHSMVEEAAVVYNDHQGNGKLVAFYKPKKMVELWPSIAEFFIYDDIVYKSMYEHVSRNNKYKAAIEKVIKDKTVLEIGPGPEAVLSRLCLDCGAKHVFAVEILEETYNKAKKCIEALGLTDKITLIHADIRNVTLPEKVDYCVSEIVGSIGGSEGSAVLIDIAKKFLKDPSHMIPSRSNTKIAAITLDESLFEYGFSEIAGYYVEKIAESFGSDFEFRLSLKNLPKENIISTNATFEDLDYSGKLDYELTHDIELTFTKDSVFNGFYVWMDLFLDKDINLDIVEDSGSWLPIFYPVSYPGQTVNKGDHITGTISRKLSSNKINPDYFINAVLYKSDGSTIEIKVESLHHETVSERSDFFCKLIENGKHRPLINADNTNLRNYLSKYLPEYMIPSGFIPLNEIPITSSGKIDRRKLMNLDIQLTGANKFVAPRNELEEKLTAIWKDLLKVEQVGVYDNFFELGGNSLLAMRVISVILKELEIELAIKDLFKFTTINDLSKYLELQVNTYSEEKDSSEYEQFTI